jgi:hypothetical protein
LSWFRNASSFDISSYTTMYPSQTRFSALKAPNRLDIPLGHSILCTFQGERERERRVEPSAAGCCFAAEPGILGHDFVSQAMIVQLNDFFWVASPVLCCSSYFLLLFLRSRRHFTLIVRLSLAQNSLDLAGTARSINSSASEADHQCKRSLRCLDDGLPALTCMLD